jgi:hypothetical protein
MMSYPLMNKFKLILIIFITCVAVLACNPNKPDKYDNFTHKDDSIPLAIRLDTSILYNILFEYLKKEKIKPNHRLPNIYSVIFSSQSDSNFMNINGNTEIPTFFEDSGFKQPDPIGVLFLGDSPVLIFDNIKPIGKQFYSMLDLNTDTIAYIVNLYDTEMAKGFLSNVIYPHWSYTFETGSRKLVLVEKSKLQFIRTNTSQRTWILTNPELFNVELQSRNGSYFLF